MFNCNVEVIPNGCIIFYLFRLDSEVSDLANGAHSKQKERDLSVLIAMLQCIFFIHSCRDSSVIDFYRKAVRAVSFQKPPVTEQLKGSYCIQL